MISPSLLYAFSLFIACSGEPTSNSNHGNDAAQASTNVALSSSTGEAATKNDFASTASDKKADYEKKREAAGKDIDKLWDLYLWCDANGMDKEGRSCLRAILKEDDTHRKAHEGLGHIEYDRKWFVSKKKLDKYKKEEEERIAKEEGLVRYEGEWVPADHVEFLERGLSLDEDGNWVDAETLAKLEAGWVKQDLIWISPDEKGKIKEGLWKCGEEWKSLEEADRYHSQLEQMWVIPGDSFTIYTTCSRELATKALEQMDRVLRDLKGALPKLPMEPVNVALLRTQDQYNEFASGSDYRTPTEASGFSSLHHGYFADMWFTGEEPQFVSAGVGFWDDSTDAGNSFGLHSARHAAAQSIVEAMDMSPKAVSTALKKGLDKWDPKAFWEEKRFPTWYRYGLVTYSERYFVDQFVGEGGDYTWASKWSLQNLSAKGGLRPLGKMFEARLSPDDYENATKLLLEYGLVMSFVLDGKCAPVVAANVALKDSIAENDPKAMAKAFEGLQKALIENEEELNKFAAL